VYRNLELLARTGVIRKLDTSGSEARFDGNTDRHYHVRCVRCGRLDDMHDLSEDPVKRDTRALNGYEILGFRLEFLGICPGCKGRPARDDEQSLRSSGDGQNEGKDAGPWSQG
jgi:Fur family ferric uptake transcriptional regulator